MSKNSLLYLIPIFVCIQPLSTRAGDWPQILGPGRDGIAVGETLLAAWPPNGPDQIWKSDVGQGFAGVAVKGDVVYLFHRKGNQEVVEARNVVTGDEIWVSLSECGYRGGISGDAGPRCVPLATEDRVIIFGVEGTLRCLDISTGKQIWTRDTLKDFGAPEGYFGAGSSPVVFRDRVIVNVGGRDNAAVVAFSIADGKTVWQSFADTASYSSPIIADINGTQHAIVVTRMNTVSLNPEDGSVRFQFPFGMRGPTVNGATPVVMGNQLFVTSSYRVGSMWAKISDRASENVASGEDLLASQYATPIKYGNLLFAVDGRQDTGSATVKCLDPAGQKVLWAKGGFDYGTLVRVNDDLLFLTCEGELIRFAADREKYRELHRSTVLEPTPQGYRLPAMSNGRLFIRDDSVLKCLRIGEQK